MPYDSSSLFRPDAPQVVATIATAADWDVAAKILPGISGSPDWLEIRADLLLAEHPTLPGDLAELPLPVLLTVRHPSEGGKGPFETAQREAIYREQGGQAFDLELATAPDFERLIADEKARGSICILSYHHFQDTPSVDELRAMTSRAADLGAHLFKVATTTHTAAQLIRLMTWLESENTLPIAAMGMGTLGKISRPLLAQLGSQLNYGHLGAPLVPGQWPAGELRQLLDTIACE